VAGSSGQTVFFDDFVGGAVDSSKWTVVDRIGDLANNEVNCVSAANVSVSGGFLVGVSKHEDRSCGDSNVAPTVQHYTSWQIQQKTAPFKYGTIEVRAKEPGGIGIWPTIWLLGYKWQASQPMTANVPGHNWPHDGWCEIDIAEFLENARNRVNNVVHFEVAGGRHEASLPFDATTRFMVYRLQWAPNSLICPLTPRTGRATAPSGRSRARAPFRTCPCTWSSTPPSAASAGATPIPIPSRRRSPSTGSKSPSDLRVAEARAAAGKRAGRAHPPHLRGPGLCPAPATRDRAG
jgi:beta-glucanase (GH16 family)